MGIDGIPIESLIAMLADYRERMSREMRREQTKHGFVLITVEKKRDVEESKTGPVRTSRRRRS